MIAPTQADVGRVVIYRPAWQRYRKLPGEEGIITSLNEAYVFVRYGEDTTSKATRRDDLEWAETAPYQPLDT